MTNEERLIAALEAMRPAFGNPNMLEQGRKMRERKQAEQIELSAQRVKSDLLARALMRRYNPETLFGLTDTPGPQTLDEAAGLDPRVDRSTFLPYSQKEGFHVPAVAADLMKLATASNPQYSNLMQPEEAMPLATNLMGGGMAASRLAPAAGLFGMNVWHGTPHRFPPTAKNPLGEFDASKIGTGEGTQAYGVGAGYLAEARDVAKRYPAMTPELVQRGYLYKVDLPDEQIAKMLDWDKPLSQQSAEVKAALQAALKADRNAFGGLSGHVKFNSSEVTGADLYKTMRTAKGEQKSIPGVGYDFGDVGASNILRDLGIPGIRYLDGGSRVGGKGTSNFVVFDPKHMNIIGRERAFTAPQDEVPQLAQKLANFVNTNNLPNQGRDLIRSKADELSTMLNQQGFQTDVKHSGSAAGPSSYVTVYDPQTGRYITDPARISGHSKGAFNSQFAHNISDDPQSMQKFVDLAMEMRAKGPSEMMKQQPVVEQAVIEMRYKNAQKKIAKGKTLTKSEQEALGYVDANGKSIHDVGFMELDEQVKWLNKFGDKNAAKLLKQESEFQDVGNMMKSTVPAPSLMYRDPFGDIE